MTAKPNQSEGRDRALARVLAEALRTGGSSSAAGSAAGDAGCPDAGLVAAYADQGLADHERSQLDVHLATCRRCQETLALLGASLDAPLGETPAEPFTAPAAAPAARVPARPARRPAQRWFWWLAPALGTAAAAMLWMVLRPASPGRTAPVQTAADYSQAVEQETASLSAQAELPPPRAAAPPEAALRRDAPSADDALAARAEPDARARQEAARDEVAALSLAEPAETAPAAPAARSAAAGNAAAPPSSGIAQGLTEAGQPPSAATLGARTQAAPAPPPPSAVPSPQTTQSVTITEETALVGGTSAAPGGTPPQQSAADLPLSGRNFAQLNLYTFTSPDGSVVWRPGVGGRIERSTDRGQTWQPQATGVTTGLVSGSAASNEVAWVVGRAGVILRTTDGANWQRIAAPEGATGDWVAVVAYNAMTATVVAADLRRFSTADGGSTWTLQ
jgi:hypothetical protein